MVRVFLAFVALILPGVVSSQYSAALITADEFDAIEIRKSISCANTWVALRAIENLTKFDPKRFGGNAILRQIAQSGCEEFVVVGAHADQYGKSEFSDQLVGHSAQAVVKKAKTMLEEDTSGKGIEVSKPRLDKNVCASFAVSNADDLGMILYGFIAEKPLVTSPLYDKAEEKTWRCGRDLWEHAITILK